MREEEFSPALTRMNIKLPSARRDRSVKKSAPSVYHLSYCISRMRQDRMRNRPYISVVHTIGHRKDMASQSFTNDQRLHGPMLILVDRYHPNDAGLKLCQSQQLIEQPVHLEHMGSHLPKKPASPSPLPSCRNFPIIRLYFAIRRSRVIVLGPAYGVGCARSQEWKVVQYLTEFETA